MSDENGAVRNWERSVSCKTASIAHLLGPPAEKNVAKSKREGYLNTGPITVLFTCSSSVLLFVRLDQQPCFRLQLHQVFCRILICIFICYYLVYSIIYWLISSHLFIKSLLFVLVFGMKEIPSPFILPPSSSESLSRLGLRFTYVYHSFLARTGFHSLAYKIAVARALDAHPQSVHDVR